MIGFGTILNSIAILAGGLIGMLFGKFVTAGLQDGLTKTCGVSVLFIGIAGALEKMLQVQDAAVTSTGAMLIVGCLALGTLVGELINIERLFERFGCWLKAKTGNAKDGGFVDAFVSASFTVCIGAMAIVGAIEDGISGDWSILAAKAALDFIIILIMTCAMGKGCLFSAIPVAVLQGSVTLLARLLQPFMTAAALNNLSMIGSVLIFCVGVNLVWGKTLRVANMLPAVLFAILAAFLPL